MLMIPLHTLSCQEENYPEKIKNFWDSIDEYEIRFDTRTGFLISGFTKDEIKSAARKYVEAKEEDAVSFTKYMVKKKQQKQDIMIWENTRYRLNVIFIMDEIMDLIRKDTSYPANFTSIMDIDYLLKMKIIRNYKIKIYTPPDGPDYITADAFSGIVEDVLKGSSKFQRGDTVDFVVTRFVENSPGYYHEGMTYLIPLKWDICGTDTYEHFAIVLPDSSHAVYPVINNRLTAPGNAFLLGDNVEISIL